MVRTFMSPYLINLATTAQQTACLNNYYSECLNGFRKKFCGKNLENFGSNSKAVLSRTGPGNLFFGLCEMNFNSIGNP